MSLCHCAFIFQIKLEIPQGIRVLRLADGLIKFDLSKIPGKVAPPSDLPSSIEVSTGLGLLVTDKRSRSPHNIRNLPSSTEVKSCGVQTLKKFLVDAASQAETRIITKNVCSKQF